MKNPKKKLTLDEIQLDSFVTSLENEDAATVDGGTLSWVTKLSKAASKYTYESVKKSVQKSSKACSVASAWLSLETYQSLPHQSDEKSGDLCKASGCVCVRNSAFPKSYGGG